jgi:hypothetical protein
VVLVSALEVELSMIRTCQKCGAEFIPRRPSEAAGAKFCSRECMGNPLHALSSPEERHEQMLERRRLDQLYRRYRKLCAKAKTEPVARGGDWEADHRVVFKQVHGREQWSYPTKRERKQSDRERFRANTSQQYLKYKALCEELGIPRQGARWASHLSELRRAPNVRADNRDLWLKTRCGYKRYWLERFSMDEIHALARGMYA